MSRSNKTSSFPLPYPLCRGYLLAVFADMSMLVNEGGCGRDHFLHWGVGVLPDGQQEFLGVWHEPVSTASVWGAIADDLTARGVEDIRFVVGSDSTGIKAAMRAAYPGVVAILSIGHFFPQTRDGLSFPPEHVGPPHALTPRHRSILVKAVSAVNRLNQGLSRAVTRHGYFPNEEAATKFVVDKINRAERDLDAFSVDAFADSARPAARAIGTARIAAPGA